MAKTLDEIFADDDFGLLNISDKSPRAETDEGRLINSFEEINAFYEKNGREPSNKSMSEYSLLARLRGFRSDENKREFLKPFDKFKLLIQVEDAKKTIDEILGDDPQGLLDTLSDKSIFQFKHLEKPKTKLDADFIAQRTALGELEFQRYEAMFHEVHQELKIGIRKLEQFYNIEKNLQVGNFYLLDGLMLYLESANLESETKNLKSGNRTRVDGRTVTIFENGTMSNMLFRSLGKAIQKNGRLITQPIEGIFRKLPDEPAASIAPELVSEDIETGWIYVLKSKSEDPKISKISNLFKIGFSRVSVPERIKNARKEETFLFADVEIIMSYRCFNLNVRQFESLLHRFFGECCLAIDVHDTNGRRYAPREWFVLPLETIELAIALMTSGDIINYRFDKASHKMIRK